MCSSDLLNLMVENIKQNGLIQPIVVIRKLKDKNTSVEDEINLKIESIRELINPKSQYNGNLNTFLTENYDYINEVLELLKVKQAKHELSDSITNINILFSPGGSSFDEFENYLVRQECYLKWVAQNVEKNSNSANVI